MVNIYSNPGEGLFHIEVRGMPGSAVRYEIRDITGKLVSENEFFIEEGVPESIDLQHTGKGAYILRLYSGGIIHNRLFVID